MAKPKLVSNAKRLCADSRDLIDESAAMILESDAARAGFMDQIEKTKEAVKAANKSRGFAGNAAEARKPINRRANSTAIFASA